MHDLLLLTDFSHQPLHASHLLHVHILHLPQLLLPLVLVVLDLTAQAVYLLFVVALGLLEGLDQPFQCIHDFAPVLLGQHQALVVLYFCLHLFQLGTRVGVVAAGRVIELFHGVCQLVIDSNQILQRQLETFVLMKKLSISLLHFLKFTLSRKIVLEPTS